MAAVGNLNEMPRVDHVGSLIRPDNLIQSWRSWEDGKLPQDELKAVQDECIRAVVALQQDIGLQLVTDGEFRRAGWQRGFMSAVDGFDFERSDFLFKDGKGTTNPAPAAVVLRQITRTRNIVTDDYAFLKEVTSLTPKVTMPTPSFMHWGHFKQGIRAEAYDDIDNYWRDLIAIYQTEIAELAKAGCTHLQLDEVLWTLRVAF